MKISQYNQGFTLIELMIVVAILGILAAIAYPSYQRYVIKTKRTDMMTEMHNIASRIESQKLVQGTYGVINTTTLGLGNYPKQGTALYTISVTTPLVREWTITATPLTGQQMATDGVLTLNAQGIKCRDKNNDGDVQDTGECGMNNQWQE